MYGSGNKALDGIAGDLEGNSQSTFSHLNSKVSNHSSALEDVLWVNINNSIASMLIDEGIETEPPAFNLMEHDHIHHFSIPNNVKVAWMNVHAPRGINRPHWAPNGMKKVMKFNEKRQPVEPPHTVARFSRFLGMLSQEASYFPINVVDWRHFYRGSNMDRAWQKIKGTLDWTDEITLELEPKIRRVCEMKMNDRWKDYKANLKKAYYTPCLHSPSVERFHCQQVNQGQWKLLVQLWDTGDAQKRATASRKNRKALQIYHTTGTKSFAQIRHEHVRIFLQFCVMCTWNEEQVNGSKPDCITFFTLTHTRKNGEPVDARSAAIIDEFNTKLKLYVDRNEIITEQVCHNVYADVLGPERYNRVRGFGTRVVWSDVKGIRTEKRGICREVEANTTSYKEQIKAANIEIERLKMEANEREEWQRIEQANVVAQLRKEQTDSMVVHNRRIQLEVENIKRELRAAMMSAPMRATNAGIVEPKRVDMSQACVTRTEQRTSLEIQASGEVEDDGFIVLHNNGTADEMVYRPCMVNVTGFSK
ncbi:hypothetical protein DVH24_013132 [Malus domestica]|uniref:Uncharacterized protein n=1 Tax=Malus domestica TaxID=3750 RepID=A0A498IPB7_MALDO|nr:hypothetical protein DVH24_013132 [Malus domestica]